MYQYSGSQQVANQWNSCKWLLVYDKEQEYIVACVDGEELVLKVLTSRKWLM
jgi:hypothetical protein